MDILAEFRRISEERADNIRMYKQHVEDIKTGALPIEKSGEDSIRYEAESLLKRVYLSFYLKRLGEIALKESVPLLNQSESERLSDFEREEKEKEKKKQLEIMVKGLGKELQGITQNISDRLVKAYCHSF